MGVHICHTGFFIQRMLFQIQTGRIHMRCHNLHPLFQRSISQMKQCNRLVHHHRIHFWLHRHFTIQHILQIHIIGQLCHVYCFTHTFPLCLACIQKFFVVSRCNFNHSQLCIIILFPCCVSHSNTSIKIFASTFLFSFLSFLSANCEKVPAFFLF